MRQQEFIETPLMTKKNVQSQQGLIGGVPEIIVALAVAGSLMGTMAVLSNKSADDIRVQNAAYQMRQLRDASELFMRQNYQVLSTVGAVQTIPLAALRGQVLPADFPDNNPLNQAYGIRIADNNGAVAGGNLTLLVFTSPAGVDTQLTPEQAAKAASLSGPEGGYIGDNTADWSAGNGGACAAAGNCAIGSFGGWRVNDLNGTFGVTPGAGGLASTGFISEASMAADVLYRANIGMPLANTMTTTMYGAAPRAISTPMAPSISTKWVAILPVAMALPLMIPLATTNLVIPLAAPAA